MSEAAGAGAGAGAGALRNEAEAVLDDSNRPDEAVAEARALRQEAEAVLQLEQEGHFVEALARADELAASHPRSALALYLGGLLHRGAAKRALRASQENGIAGHLISAYNFLAEAARLVPNCIGIATMLASVLRDGLRFEEAASEARRAICIFDPVDPADNNPEYSSSSVRSTTRAQRVENARTLAHTCFSQVMDEIREVYVRDKVREVLDISKRPEPGTPAEALRQAKELAGRFVYSSRALYFHGYMSLKFARGLDAGIDRRRFLDRILRDMNRAASMFVSSLVIAKFRAKLCFVLGLYPEMEAECWRAIGIKSPTDPGDEDVPPGCTNGEDHDDRVLSIYEDLNGLLLMLKSAAQDYWCSMTSEKRDMLLSVKLDELHMYYDNYYEQDYWAIRTTADALSYVKKNSSWRFWICPLCVGNKKFTDVNSFSKHMCKKHPKFLSKLQSVLDPRLSGEDTSQGDYSLDEITICQDSHKKYVFHFKKTAFVFDSVFLLPSSGIEAQPFSEVREKKCAEGRKTLEEIQKKLNRLPAERSSTEFDKAHSEIEDLWHNFLATCVLDYVEIILPLAKSFLWNTLLKCMSKDANIASKIIDPSDVDKIFPDVADAPASNMTVEHGSKPSHANKTSHTSRDDGHTNNLMSSSSDDTSNKDEENPKSEVNVDDIQANVELDTKETLVKPAKESPKTSSYQRSVDILNEINGDEGMFILYAIIQSLWNLRNFREKFLMRPPVCFLPIPDKPHIAEVFYKIISSWEKNEHHGMAPLLTSLKTIISNLNVNSMFQKSSSEIMATLLKGLHKSEMSLHFGSNVEMEGQVVRPITCRDCICRTHNLFGIKFLVQTSCKCGKCFDEKEHTTVIHKLDVGSPETTKIKSIKSFAELPVLWDGQLPCLDNCVHCGTPRNLDVSLSNTPHYFTIVLRLNDCKSQVTFSEALAGITCPLDVNLLCKDVHSAANYTMTFMICHVDGRYVCFARDQDRWLIYEAKTVKIEDTWERVLERFRNCKLQPEVLVFEVIK